MLSEAWTIGSLDYGATQVRTGHTIIALLANEELARLTREISKELAKIPVETLKKDFTDDHCGLVRGSRRDVRIGAAAQARHGGSGRARRAAAAARRRTSTSTPSTSPSARRQGKIDPVLGRDFEIRQVVDILLRRRQNNPILVGEAGVGKTAVVEGFALRIANGDVPPPLQNVTLRTLDLALLQAGAGVKGEFENRLKGLIEEVKNSPTPIILFIDEAHTMIGAGGAGRTERRGQSAQAGARARRAAHHRRHHVVRIQEVLREGSRARPPLPGREGRRADRRQCCMQMLRGIAAVAREAPQRPHPRRAGSPPRCVCRIAICRTASFPIRR